MSFVSRACPVEGREGGSRFGRRARCTCWTCWTCCTAEYQCAVEVAAGPSEWRRGGAQGVASEWKEQGKRVERARQEGLTPVGE